MRPARILAVASTAWALAVAASAQAVAEAIFPAETWAVVDDESLEAHGWSRAGLEQTTRFIRDESNTTGLVIVDGGRVLYEYGDVEELSYVASVRKSILAMLQDYWVEMGGIDLEPTPEELGMNDFGGLLPSEKKATVERLITAVR